MSDPALVAALRRQMTIAVVKQVAAAGNLANVDTQEGIECACRASAARRIQSALVKPDKVSSEAGRLKRAR